MTNTAQDNWANSLCMALRNEVAIRGKRDDDWLRVHSIRSIDANRVEVQFSVPHHNWRQIFLVIDGQEPLSEDFLPDIDDEKGQPTNSLDISEVAWRIYVLGMREPFSFEELVIDADGRLMRPIQP